jgi:hypothetical protein
MMSSKFKVTLAPVDTTRIRLGDTAELRVPERKKVANAANGHVSAASAGASTADAEIAENNGSADVSYNGDAIRRRAGLAVRVSTSALTSGVLTGPAGMSTSNWALCDSNTKRCSPAPTNSTTDTTVTEIGDLQTFDMGGKLTLHATASARLAVHSLTQFFATNAGDCTTKTEFSEQDYVACTAQLKYDVDAQYKGLRGVFMIRDNADYYFYHLTEPIP